MPPLSNPIKPYASPVKYAMFMSRRLRALIRDRSHGLIFKYMSPYSRGRFGARFWNRSFKIHRDKLVPEATRLHSAMYEAFASGNVPQLREMCCDGVLATFHRRIMQRKKGEKVEWKLVRMNRKPKLVSDRIAMIPGKEGTAIRQAVVRIMSRQELKNGGVGQEKDLCEYVVVQQKIERWNPLKWMIWGTTQETTLEDAEKWRKAARAAKGKT
jgi:protein MBA1